MISPQDRLRDTIADVTHQFREHRATLHTFPNNGNPFADGLTALDWAKPGTGICRVRYLWRAGTLFVDGDLGEAVYRWRDTISLPFLATCSLEYFHGKLCASEQGRHYVTFDEDVAEWRLTERLNELQVEGSKLTPRFREFLHEDWFGDREDLVEFANDIYRETGDCELASDISQAGDVPDCRLVAHWLGLRLAHQQLTAGSAGVPLVAATTPISDHP